MFRRVAEIPAVLALMGKRDVQLNFVGSSTYKYIHVVRKVLAFEQNFGHICLVFTVAMEINDVASHITDITIIC